MLDVVFFSVKPIVKSSPLHLHSLRCTVIATITPVPLPGFLLISLGRNTASVVENLDPPPEREVKKSSFFCTAMRRWQERRLLYKMKVVCR